MPYDPIHQMLTDVRKYAFGNYHAPPIRTGSGKGAAVAGRLRPDRTWGIDSVARGARQEVQHNKSKMVKPVITHAGTLATTATTVTITAVAGSAAAGPMAPFAAAGSVGAGLIIGGGFIVQAELSKAVRLRLARRRKDKSLADCIRVLRGGALERIAARFEDAASALVDIWEHDRDPFRDCHDAVRHAFRVQRLNHRLIMLTGSEALPVLGTAVEKLAGIFDDAISTVSGAQKPVFELAARSEPVLRGDEWRDALKPSQRVFGHDGIIDWHTLVHAANVDLGASPGLVSLILRGRKQGDPKETFRKITQALDSHRKTPQFRAAQAAAGGARSVATDMLGTDAMTGHAKDFAKGMAQSLVSELIKGEAVWQATVEAAGGQPQSIAIGLPTQLAASIGDTVVKIADERMNLKTVQGPLPLLAMNDKSSEGALRDYVQRVWALRKLLETNKLEPLLKDQQKIDHEQELLAKQILRWRTTLGPLQAGDLAGDAKVRKRISASLMQRHGDDIAPCPDEAVALLYRLQGKAFRMLERGYLTCLLQETLDAGMLFMFACMKQNTDKLVHRTRALMSGASGPCPGTCYHLDTTAADPGPVHPVG